MFEVAAEAYGAFMGRFSVPLAVEFVEAAAVTPGQTALDVGCGTGALTAVLVDRLGAAAVSAADPSAAFVEATRRRFPGMDVRKAFAEALPHESGTFDVALAQLVVHFLRDPVGGIAEMARVCRPGGLVALNVWDHAGGAGPLEVFWTAVRSLDSAAPDESHLPGVREGQLAEYLTAAGLDEVRATALTVVVPHASFDAWWQPFTLGVGPAGAYVAGLSDAGREELRRRCAEVLPDGAFATTATAWAAFGRVVR